MRLAFATFFAVHLLGWAGYSPLFLTSYADDLLCMPLVLGLIQSVQRIWAREEAFRLPAWHVGLVVGLFSVLFEGVLPRLSPRYTADSLDVVCYGLGALVFLHAMRGEAVERKRAHRLK